MAEVRTYEYEGKIYTTAQIAEKLGVKKKTMEKRLRMNDYDLLKCLTKPTNHNFKDMTGEKFGRWTVIEKDDCSENNRTKWLCKCDCGNQASVDGATLRNGTSLSCGCYVVELKQTHGKTKSKTYRTWEGMVQRCGNPSNPQYHNYVGRGIKVCEEWLKFENFYNDIGDIPVGLEIDRKDNHKGYSKDNVRLVTKSVNLQNTRQSRRWYLNGKEYNTALEAAKELGVSKSVIRARCNGYTDRGVWYPPKDGCYSKLVYEIEEV